MEKSFRPFIWRQGRRRLGRYMINQKNLPLISILMGVYYRQTELKGLRRSVESILSQSYTNFELLLCDDGSSQEAVHFLNQTAEKDRRVVLIRPGGALLLPTKLNCCLRLAKGTYIARMDDDDVAHPARLAKQMAFLLQNQEIDFVGCNVYLARQGEVVGKRQMPEFPVVRDFYMTQPYIHPALLFRREPLLAVNGYSESPHVILCEDYDLLLRLYAKGYRGANLQQFLLTYTIPDTAKGSRRMRHRWNEVVTRYNRFRELHVLSEAWPYVVKPLAVGLLPEDMLKCLKERRR